MGREGPCLNCGITYTPLWRSGPPEKPVLCNSCGTRWRLRGSLKDYTPKHVISGEVPLRRKPGIPPKVARYSQQSTCIEEDAKNRPWSASSPNGSKRGSVNDSDQSTVSNPVPKKQRSGVLSPMEKFQWEMYCLSQQPEFSKLHEEQEDVLIYNEPSNQTPNEIGLGAVLLKPPPSPNN